MDEGGPQASPAEDRYLMTVIATASNPQFSVSRVDIERPGQTFTIDTLREMREISAATSTVLHHGRRRARADVVMA